MVVHGCLITGEFRVLYSHPVNFLDFCIVVGTGSTKTVTGMDLSLFILCRGSSPG